MLQGEKIVLRDLRESDLPAVLEWRNDTEVTEFLSTLEMSELELEDWYRDSAENESNRLFAIDDKSTKRLIGYVALRQLDWDERSAVLDIMIGDKSLWNKGFGKDAIKTALNYAFDELALTRVRLYVLPFNLRGISCYERCGFRKRGTVREFYFRRGRLWNLIEMEVLAQQFRIALKYPTPPATAS